MYAGPENFESQNADAIKKISFIVFLLHAIERNNDNNNIQLPYLYRFLVFTWTNCLYSMYLLG